MYARVFNLESIPYRSLGVEMIFREKAQMFVSCVSAVSGLISSPQSPPLSDKPEDFELCVVVVSLRKLQSRKQSDTKLS